MNYQDVSLITIRKNPRNPRKTYEGRNFDELVASIAVKGVIQPIVIRPIKKTSDGTVFEVVAGNRRFMASLKLSAARKMPTATIPAVIRDLSDGEAFEFMMIENLQREDLTDLEEAQSFRGFIESRKKEGKNGSAVAELGKRIGLNPRYIRSRIDVLSLPKYVLIAWDNGTLSYGHLQQLLRITDTKNLRGVFNWTLQGFNDEPETIISLKNKIDQASPELKYALFDQKECKTCPKNSSIQIALWDIGDEKALRCHQPKCFIMKQRQFLKKNWQETLFFKHYKTTGFRFKEEVDWDEWQRFYQHGQAFMPDKQCKECKDFITLISYKGQVDEEKACINKSCYNRRDKAWQNRGKSDKKEAAAGSRVSWHGEFFREEFLTKKLPGKFAEHAPLADDESIRLAMFGFASTGHHFKSMLAKDDDLSLFYVEGNVRLWQLIEKMNMGEVKAWLVKFAEDIILNRQEVSADARLKIAEFLGVKLLKEFSVTEDYLQKKTIKEMLIFGQRADLFTRKKMLDYLQNTIKKSTYTKCKKTELIDCFMKSGVELVGRIPEEIIPAKK